MNAAAKTQLLTFRVSPAMKAALQARADAVADGSMSLVIQRLIAHAIPRWNTAIESEPAAVNGKPASPKEQTLR
jgi:diadenosine tetraphosphate (Ap4A) HIT family hydrolase